MSTEYEAWIDPADDCFNVMRQLHKIPFMRSLSFYQFGSAFPKPTVSL